MNKFRSGDVVGCGSARLGLSVRQCPLALEYVTVSRPLPSLVPMVYR